MLQVVWPAHNLWNILANLCFVHSQLFKNTHRLLSAETAAVLLKQTTSFLKSDVCFFIFHTRYTTLRPSELPGRQDWKLKYKILIFLLPLAQWLMFCFYTRSYSCMNNKQNIMNITFNLNIILRYLTTSGYFSEYSGGAAVTQHNFTNCFSSSTFVTFSPQHSSSSDIYTSHSDSVGWFYRFSQSLLVFSSFLIDSQHLKMHHHHTIIKLKHNEQLRVNWTQKMRHNQPEKHQLDKNFYKLSVTFKE